MWDTARGAIYVFERHHGGVDNWGRLQKIESTANGADRHLGFSIALSGAHLVAASDVRFNSGQLGGAMHFYRRNTAGFGEIWVFANRQGESSPFADVAIEGAIALAPFREGSDLTPRYDLGALGFWQRSDLLATGGDSVAIRDELAVVGDSSARNARGVATVFDLSNGSSVETQRLTTEDSSLANVLRFGRSVAIAGDRLVIGADSLDLTAGAVGRDTGAAFIYTRQDGRWGASTHFTSSDAKTGGLFGWAVDISGNTVAVATPFFTAPGGSLDGAAYVFEIDPSIGAFSEWQRGTFDDAVVDDPALESTVWAATADLDADGHLNYQEAYHGTDPSVADAHLAELQSSYDATTDELIIRWRKSKQTRGVSAEVQWSPDLQSWFSSGTAPGQESVVPPAWEERIHRDGGDHFIMEARVPTGGRSRMFARLVVLPELSDSPICM